METIRSATPDSARKMAMWLAMAASSMMFAGITSAYVVSQGLSPVWRELHMRPLVAIDTGVLLISSVTMERARRRGRRSQEPLGGLLATLSLGLLFLAGQAAVFGQLAREGYHLNTGRQSSFYYVLTSLHGLHVLAGLTALAWLAIRMKNASGPGDPRSRTRIEIMALYWHFMGALWLYLLVVLFL